MVRGAGRETEGALWGQHSSEMNQGRDLVWETGTHLFTDPVTSWTSCFSPLGLSFSVCQAARGKGVGLESL